MTCILKGFISRLSVDLNHIFDLALFYSLIINFFVFLISGLMIEIRSPTVVLAEQAKHIPGHILMQTPGNWLFNGM